MDITAAILKAFSNFVSDTSLCALPISLVNASLEPLPPVAFPQDPNHTFQQALNQVESILDTKTALYLIIRQEKSMVAITYVPYRADAETKRILLENREILVEKLGTKHFTSSIICKEIGEITDARSWEERSTIQQPGIATDHTHNESCKDCQTDPEDHPLIQDLGHQRTKCRLCDRRMKNKITPDALHALKNLTNPGDCVQLSLNPQTDTLTLTLHLSSLAPPLLPSHLPASIPTFTFYRHASTDRVYFIFCSPDTAPVTQRMKSTMAIPGLVNVIARDEGVDVEQKVEIHEGGELELEEGDGRVGRYRSVYLRGGRRGTESVWEGMEEYQRGLDAVR